MKGKDWLRAGLAVLAAALAVSVPSGADLPAEVNALWVAESAGALKISTAGGQMLLEIAEAPDARAVAVDPWRSTVWLYSGQTLLAYGFDGTRRLAVPVALPASSRADLAVHPGDGSVWLAVGRELRSVSASGQILSSVQPFGGAGTIAELVTDPSDASAWVAAGTAVAQIGASGGLVRAVNVQPPVQIWDLAVYADIVPPGIEILAPPAGAVLDTGSPEIRVTWSDIGSGVAPATLAFLLDGAPLAVSCAPVDEGASCGSSSTTSIQAS